MEWLQSKPKGLSALRIDGVNSIKKASSLETHEELIFLFMATGKKRPVSQLRAARLEFREGSVFCASLQLID